MAALSGSGFQVCLKMCYELGEKYSEKCKKINQMIIQPVSGNRKRKIWEAEVIVLAGINPKTMCKNDRVREMRYLLDVVIKIKKIEALSFQLLNSLLDGTRRIEEGVEMSLDGQEKETLAKWGHYFLNVEEQIEKFIDRLDLVSVYVQKAINVFGLDISLDPKAEYNRWWRRELFIEDFWKARPLDYKAMFNTTRKENKKESSLPSNSYVEFESKKDLDGDCSHGCQEVVPIYIFGGKNSIKKT
ncbi:MAG TPA: hypothetical protein DCE71_06465 [Parachlamydiales bacterium]|nr:hypothetical protein [Parachlamydiales bacterium]